MTAYSDESTKIYQPSLWYYTQLNSTEHISDFQLIVVVSSVDRQSKQQAGI